MRWTGFRRVHKQVCKRLARRLTELELSDLDSYRQYLSSDHDEWPKLDSLCRVVVTRFYRDKRVFGELAERVLPQLAAAAQAAGRKILHAWSIGSASGEEAYTRHSTVTSAPKNLRRLCNWPTGMDSNDWTSDVPTAGFPAARISHGDPGCWRRARVLGRRSGAKVVAVATT
jgi:hypothetical protein